MSQVDKVRKEEFYGKHWGGIVSTTDSIIQILLGFNFDFVAEGFATVATLYELRQGPAALLIATTTFIVAAITGLFTYFARRKSNIRTAASYAYFQSVQFILTQISLNRQLVPIVKQINTAFSKFLKAELSSEEENAALEKLFELRDELLKTLVDLISVTDKPEIPHVTYPGFASKGKLRNNFYDAMQLAISIRSNVKYIEKQILKEENNVKKLSTDEEKENMKNQIISIRSSALDLLGLLRKWETYTLNSIRISGVQLNFLTRRVLWVIFCIEEPLRKFFAFIIGDRSDRTFRKYEWYCSIQKWTMTENPWWYPFWFWDNYRMIKKSITEAQKESHYAAQDEETENNCLISFDELFQHEILTIKLTNPLSKGEARKLVP